MRSRRRRLICRWFGVVILGLWTSSFLGHVGIAWNPKTILGLRAVEFLEVSKGLLIFYRNLVVPWKPGLRVSGPPPVTLPISDYLIGRHEYNPTLFGGSTTVEWFVIIPATIPLGSSAALIGFSFWLRHPKGHCPKCGYDLKGIADQCPECGRMVQAEAP